MNNTSATVLSHFVRREDFITLHSFSFSVWSAASRCITCLSSARGGFISGSWEYIFPEYSSNIRRRVCLRANFTLASSSRSSTWCDGFYRDVEIHCSHRLSPMYVGALSVAKCRELCSALMWIRAASYSQARQSLQERGYRHLVSPAQLAFISAASEADVRRLTRWRSSVT